MILDEKKIIRNKIKNILLEYSNNFEKESFEIFNKIINSTQFYKADTILSYMALPDEVDIPIHELYKACNKEKNIYIPKVIFHTMDMEYYKYFDNIVIESGAYNIQEPVSSGELFSLNSQEYLGNILVLVPGRAFTKNGKRLGRGKGFYDKFLYRLINNYKREQITIAGVCFTPQILSNLPDEKHDIKMDLIFTAQ